MNGPDEMEVVHPETGEVLNPQEAKPAPDKPGKNLDEALENAIKELPVWITQDETAKVELKTGGSYTHKYATFKAIMTVVRPVLLKHGVRVRFGCDHAWQLDTGSTKGRCVPVFAELKHTASGQMERTTIEVPLMRMDAPGMGSAISFGKRYGILAALGLATDEAEDDGLKTKGRDVADDHEESQELWVLRAEISECATMSALSTLRDKAKEKGRLDKLSDADFALAQKAFKERKAQIEIEQDGKAKK